MFNINQKVKKHLEKKKQEKVYVKSNTNSISRKTKNTIKNKINNKVIDEIENKSPLIKRKNSIETTKQLSDRFYKIMFNNRQKPIDEEWKDIVGYEGIYMVSNYGLVIRKDNYRIVGTYYTGDEPWNRKYDIVTLSKNGKGTAYQIHRLVALAFVENLNPNKFNVVNHIDENIHNNYYKNLEWCDNQYNLHYGSANQKRLESLKLRREWNEYIKTSSDFTTIKPN